MNVKAARRLYLFSMSEKRDSSKSGKKEARKRSSTKTPQQKREDKLRKKLKQSEGEIVSLKDRLLRAAAELDNYRKRTEREFARIVQNANGELIKVMTYVVTQLNRFGQASFSLSHLNNKDIDWYALIAEKPLGKTFLIRHSKMRSEHPEKAISKKNIPVSLTIRAGTPEDNLFSHRIKELISNRTE